MKLYRAEALFDGDGRMLRDVGVVVDEGGTLHEIGSMDAIKVIVPGEVTSHSNRPGTKRSSI